MFDKTVFLNKFAKDSVSSALKYLAEVQPEQLFKFYSLTKDEDLNKKKLDTLSDGKIWVDIADNQNDPFEMVGLNVDENSVKPEYKNDGEILLPKELLTKAMQQYMDNIKKRIKISSFCQKIETNISMWAYYTNSHEGFCCEYEPIEKNVKAAMVLKPILYEEGIVKVTSGFIQHLIGTKEKLLGDSDEERANTMLALEEYIKLLCSYKSISWKHEEEYRGFYIGDDKTAGEAVEFSKLNVKLKAIYSGIKCSAENKEKLKEIATKLKVQFYEMKVSSDKFSLIRCPAPSPKEE